VTSIDLDQSVLHRHASDRHPIPPRRIATADRMQVSAAEPLRRAAGIVAVWQPGRRVSAYVQHRQTYWLGLDIMDECNFEMSGQRPASVT
jgi:hypothetical protein